MLRMILALEALLLAVPIPGESARAQTLAFSDQTVPAGLAAAAHDPPAFYISGMLSGGAAGDFDGDGWQDLFVAMGGNVPDRLYINDGDGTFTDEAPAWGANASHVGGGSAAGDYDGDGRLDLFVASMGPAALPVPGRHLLYRNLGNGTFDEVAAAAGVETTSPSYPDGFGAAWGDYDLDGALDLFVNGWTVQDLTPNGNVLFHNEGDGTFTDATSTAMPTDFDGVAGFTPQFVDMDGDRWPELLLACDFGDSHYLRNDGDGTFTDVTVASGTGLDSNGMGQTFGDFDRDGVLDWYVTSIHAEPGTLWENASGNMLYTGAGDHQFVESSFSAGVNDGGWGWGAVAVDLDHDGWLDIAETNGWNAEPFIGEQAYLYRNAGDGTFVESAVAAGLDYASNGRGLLYFDADNDGDQDLVFFSNMGELRYYRNDLSGPDTNWLVVALDSAGATDVAPGGLGARITASVGGASLVRVVTGGGSYLSSCPLDAHFGLGAATAVDELRIDWPDGTVTWLEDVAANQRVTVACCGGWKDVGPSLAGSAGAPSLAGQGTLQGGDVVSLAIANGLASRTAFLVLGLAELSASFKGGVLVPSPDVILPVPLDAGGGLLLPFPWPANLPGGVPLWWQAWIPDPAGIFGFAATNGVRSTTP